MFRVQASAGQLGVLDIQVKLSPLEDVYLAVVGHTGAVANDKSSSSSSSAGSSVSGLAGA